MAKLPPPTKAQPVADPVATVAPDITPHTGGSYIRQPDGRLQRVPPAPDAVAETTHSAPLQPDNIEEPQQ